MSVSGQLMAEASSAFEVDSYVVEKRGPQVNVGEEFLVEFTVKLLTTAFRFQQVEITIVPYPAVCKVVPHGSGASSDAVYTAAGEARFALHYCDCSHTINPKRVRFQALGPAFLPMQRPFCKVILETHGVEVYLDSTCTTMERTLILGKVKACANGHEYPSSSPFLFCPLDGLPLS